MDKKHLAEKVGLFVFVCLVLIAALLIMFSKGVTQFAHSYELHLKTADAGGIKPGANVLMVGYPIGNVQKLVLQENGQAVVLILKIVDKYRIRTNAIFVLEQAGFLGDQFVAVYPNKTNLSAPYLEPGSDIYCAPPFNLQQTARDASGFIKRIDKTAEDLNAAIADVRRNVLNENTLTNLAGAAVNLHLVTERALNTVDSIDAIIATNAPLLGISASNIVTFSAQISGFAGKLDDVLSTNGNSLNASMQNIQAATISLKKFADDLQSGQGLLGALVRNEKLAADVEALAANLSTTSSNLNRRGLWGILWSHKPDPPPKTPAETK